MNWDSVIDFFQELMIFILIIVVVVCIITLISFDILAGTGIMMYLTNNQLKESVVISLATSGLLIALMFVGYSLSTNQKKVLRGLGWAVFVGAVVVYGLDVYFDSLTADYLRFKQIVVLDTLPKGDVQLLFRILIGGISAVGETLAVIIILGMPVLKKIVSDALPKQQKGDNRPQNNQKQPSVPHRPNFHRIRQDNNELFDKLPKRKDN